MTALVPTLLAFALASADDIPIRGNAPVYELLLPSGYQPVSPQETPARFVRPRGRSTWELVSVFVVDSTTVLTQNPDRIRAEDVASRVPFPPEAKWTFVPLRWKDFDIGSFEYRAVVKEMPVVGFSAVLPLLDGSVTIVVYAPEPLEKECREEFQGILARVTRAPNRWHSPEHYRRIRSMNRITTIAGVLMALYGVAWAVVFRGDPMRAHWLRVAWLAVIAILLFIPITSPGEMTFANNMLVNLMLPIVVLLFVSRRIKLGIEMG